MSTAASRAMRCIQLDLLQLRLRQCFFWIAAGLFKPESASLAHNGSMHATQQTSVQTTGQRAHSRSIMQLSKHSRWCTQQTSTQQIDQVSGPNRWCTQQTSVHNMSGVSNLSGEASLLSLQLRFHVSLRLGLVRQQLSVLLTAR